MASRVSTDQTIEEFYPEEHFSPELSPEARGGHSYIVLTRYYREEDRREAKEVEFRVVAPSARDALAIVAIRAESVRNMHNRWCAEVGHIGGMFPSFEVFSVAWRGRVGLWTNDEIGEQQ